MASRSETATDPDLCPSKSRIANNLSGGLSNTGVIQAPESKVQWTQDTDEVTVELQVAKNVSKKSVELEVHPRRLDLSIDGTSHLSGTLDKEIDVDGRSAAIQIALTLLPYTSRILLVHGCFEGDR